MTDAKSMVGILEWVLRHPQELRTSEKTLRAASSLAAGMLKDSDRGLMYSELMASVADLIGFAIVTAEHSKVRIPCLETASAFLSASELLAESASWLIGGGRAQRKLVISYQILKFVTKLASICWRTTTKSSNRPDTGEKLWPHAATVQLKRSGRVLRTIKGSQELLADSARCPRTEASATLSTWAEIIYYLQPVVRLGLSCKSGHRSWRPWTVSLALDLLSIIMAMVAAQKATKSARPGRTDKASIRNKVVRLLMYTLRSPFYDRYTKVAVMLASCCLEALPVVGVAFEDLDTHINHYRKLHYYMWSK